MSDEDKAILLHMLKKYDVFVFFDGLADACLAMATSILGGLYAGEDEWNDEMWEMCSATVRDVPGDV